MQIIQVQNNNGIYSCDVGISKKEWLEILKETSTRQSFKDALYRFYYMPQHKGTCSAVSSHIGGNSHALNILVSKFGEYVRKRLNRFQVLGSDGKPSRWIIPMNNGRHLSSDEEGSFEWQLRPELADALKQYLYLYLVTVYKQLRKEVPLHVKNPSYNELYKWELIDTCKGKDIMEIAELAAKTNLVDTPRVNGFYQYLLKEHPNELRRILEMLIDESIPLEIRLREYKKAMSAVHAPSFKNRANDERTAATILTCYAPQQYTFYKAEGMYDNLCKYIGEERVATGRRYEHYLQLIKPLAAQAEQDVELMQMIADSTNGLLNSSLLLAQDIVWMILYAYPERLGFLHSILSPNPSNKTNSMESKYQKYIDLLETNKNLILTGAPGTGKTFIAKAIAEEMGAEVGFVQFHPSYDYTDFVEGLRPINKSDSQMGFERKDGVFKVLCHEAIKNIEDSRKSKQELTEEKTLEEKYDELINKIENGEIQDIPLKTGVKMEIVRVSDNNNIILRTSGKIGGNEYTVSFDRLAKLAKAFPDVDSLNAITNIFKAVTAAIRGCHSSSYWGVLNEVYKQGGSIKTESQIEIVRKPFVFIIDEINRGEISKIFGELFFSIDPGYRGEKGKVNTQYQNMIEDGDVFKEGFYVPENVYIIGTMNDIDRSVESMDFAMRRRFAFEEVTAEESYANMIENEPEFAAVKDEIKCRMFSLNKAIAETEGLNEAYQIGAAYFRKYLDYADRERPFDCLWNNHLKGLLFEYLRGNRKAKELLEKLHKAYNTTNANEQAAHTDER